MAKCDFCSTESEVRFSFPACDFTAYAARDDGALVTVGRSIGPWFACPVCAALVRADQREALAVRCREVLRVTNPAAADLELVRTIQGAFFEARCGPECEVT